MVDMSGDEEMVDGMSLALMLQSQMAAVGQQLNVDDDNDIDYNGNSFVEGHAAAHPTRIAPQQPPIVKKETTTIFCRKCKMPVPKCDVSHRNISCRMQISC